MGNFLSHFGDQERILAHDFHMQKLEVPMETARGAGEVLALHRLLGVPL